MLLLPRDFVLADKGGSVGVIYCSNVAHAWVLLTVLTCYYCCSHNTTQLGGIARPANTGCYINALGFETESAWGTCKVGVINDSLCMQSSHGQPLPHCVQVEMQVKILMGGVAVDLLDTHCRDHLCACCSGYYRLINDKPTHTKFS